MRVRFRADADLNLAMSMPNQKGVKITDVVLGDGAVAEVGTTVTVEWRGWLNRGEEFGNGTSSFRIGCRDVIAGLERGTTGMKVGGVRRLRVSPHLGYRDRGAPGVPPDAVLEFEVKLLNVSTPAAERVLPRAAADGMNAMKYTRRKR